MSGVQLGGGSRRMVSEYSELSWRAIHDQRTHREHLKSKVGLPLMDDIEDSSFRRYVNGEPEWPSQMERL